jgi:hypothetical protein
MPSALQHQSIEQKSETGRTDHQPDHQPGRTPHHGPQQPLPLPGRGHADNAAAGADRFCAYTGFPRSSLQVDREPTLHRALGLYAGLAAPGGAWPSLLLMCAGLGSPGTLQEVLRGYLGDRSAPSRLAMPLFDLVGRGYQRPFELATVRLANMREVLGAWGTYVPDARWITQRGGTFLLDIDDSLLYSHRDPGILGFSETMADPLLFLEPWLGDPSPAP